jgi:hypothetical protein
VASDTHQPVANPAGPCDHTAASNATVELHPLSAQPGGPVTSFYADVRISCACGEPFVFIGPGIGVSPRQPMVSFDGQELRAPIRPASAPEGWGQQGPGFGLSAVHTPAE